ncbi:cupin domain-containing protein [Sneathiella aquimaris]|uniref:cupin domain-containing protein n=1 Tax=Sneathiella aquimaris TaxID=2599305 RepID=UPI00146D700C|nr:cupin [Sneathiella aquimaris]
MRKIVPSEFAGKLAWDALDIEFIKEATVRLHWTDQPYKWHINNGPEVFVVLEGNVDMFTRENGEETLWKLKPGDIFHAEEGDEHIAHPQGIARILVIEQAGSV